MMGVWRGMRRTSGMQGMRTRRPVSGRSVGLGLAGVLLICALTPFNNYVLRNTDLVGNHLPASLLIFFLLFVLLVNGLLLRWWPRQALSGGELAVALGMTLVGCALPSVGLMRYLPGHLVAPFGHAAISHQSAELLRQLDLPDWMWPTMQAQDPAARGLEPVVRDFHGRIAVQPDTFLNRLRAIPWSAWVQPAFSWGILLAALYGAVICMSVIFRRQWVENERLPFPLASVYLALIEPPEQGRLLSPMLRSRSFWIAFAAVFAIHALGALNTYWPQYWPPLPLRFDLTDILADAPFNAAQLEFKRQQIYFTVIGLMFFVQTRIAFSLWFFFVLMQVVRMGYGMHHAEFTGAMEDDQRFGAVLALAVVTLWIARHQLAMVWRQMIGRARPGEATGRYLPYALAGWGLLASVIVLVGWLVMAGASVMGAVVLIAVIGMVYFVLARVVAETGLLYVLLPVVPARAWLYAHDLTGARTTLGSIFFSNYLFGMLLHDTREASPVFVTHALRVADEQAYGSHHHWRSAIAFTGCLVLALVVALVVSGASTLYIHYSYAASVDQAQEQPIGAWGSWSMPRYIALDGTAQYMPPRGGPVEHHSRLGHFGFGAAATAVLGFMNLRFAAWPLHPVGFLLAMSWGTRQIWFSIFLGWLAKALIVNYGGSSLLTASRPALLGLIFGEAGAVAFWLSASLLLHALGEPYHAIWVLPG